jgi:GTP-binding protein Era
MNRGVRQALAEVDVVLLVVEAGRFDERDRAGPPAGAGRPAADHRREQDRPVARQGRSCCRFSPAWPARASSRRSFRSARRAATSSRCCSTEARKHLPNEELLFAEDEMTDRSERFLAAEYIREKLFRLIGDELPYAAAGRDRALRRRWRPAPHQRGDPRRSRGHKPIVIGRSGEVVKRIASEARQDMERLFGGPVFLEVFVKVKSGWADDERMLKTLGYE